MERDSLKGYFEKRRSASGGIPSVLSWVPIARAWLTSITAKDSQITISQRFPFKRTLGRYGGEESLGEIDFQFMRAIACLLPNKKPGRVAMGR